MSEQDKRQDKPGVSRREFLQMASAVAVGLGLGGEIGGMILLDNNVIAIPASKGYILVDTTKCAGCTTCMAACSLAHDGAVNLSLSRIQIIRDPLGNFGDDIFQEQCRQCTYPACVEVCPTGAMHADKGHRNVRMVDEGKCIGCMRCVEACPFLPKRVQFNPEERHAQKCDLCADTPYWDGDQPACATLCPMGAIKFTEEIPTQYNNDGYRVDLKPATWGKWWPYINYTTWPHGQTADPATWPQPMQEKPVEGGKSK